MSKTVDERVVEMRFDNANFEKNVSNSMSTLDKLKEKLSFKGAAKGLESLDAASRKVNMNGLGQGVDTVNAKFSALQVAGMTAISRLTNAAITAGQKMASALTIDPVRDGFREYETQLNAVQTILANTQSEGTNVKTVNAALKQLNDYADLTIYNFTEMTRNIGTFTAAGVKLNDSVNAIKGIANLAAISGSSSQQASTAMYQLSQALAAGKVNLQDWNSVVNAGMGGKVFQDALIRTSEHLKTGAKNAIKANGSFRESIRKGWMTQEVLTQTLDQFATAADSQEEYQAAIKKFVSQGYTQEEAKQMADMARTAGNAATKVKTFTQLIDTLKEALGSGWAQTWQLIFGDFEEAKSLWTGISDVLGNFIAKMSDARNTLLESALAKGFGKLTKKIDGMLKPAKKASDAIKKTVDTVSDLGDIVDKVILGKFGNGKERFDALTKAGYNWCEVQNKVNEKLGSSFRYTKEQIAAQDKVIGGTKKEKDETVKLTKEKKNLIKKIASMTEEQMRSAGYNDKQIAAFKELGDTAKKLGMPLNEFIDKMDKITGRWLLIESFKNIGRSIAKVFSAIGKAWRQTFDAIKPKTIFNLLAGFHKLTRGMILNKEESKKLVRTFKGLFALLDIITTVVGGGFKLAFKAASAILGAFGLDILDATAMLGDLIVKFRDFLFDNKLVDKMFTGLASGVKMAVKAITELVDKFKNSDIGKNIIAGLKNGLEKGITEIPKMLMNIGKTMIEAICNVLGIHSPSVEMEKIGKFTIEGLINGLKSGIGKVWDVLSNLGTGVIDFIKNFNWDKAFALGASVFLLATVKKMVGIVDSISAPLNGLRDLLSGAGEVLRKSAKGVGKILKSTSKVITSFSKILNAKAWKIKAEALKDVAISIGILAASVYVLAQLDAGSLWSAVGAITVLAGVLIGLSIAMDKLSSASIGLNREKGLDIKGLKTGLLGIGLAILLIAASVKLLGSMDENEALNGFSGLAKIILMICGIFAVYGLLVKGKGAQNMDKAGKMMKKMAVTMLLMIAVCKLAGMLTPEEMLKGAGFAVAFLGFVAVMALITKLTGKGVDKLGGMMLKISFAMLLMVGVCKLIGKLSKDEMIKGGVFALAFVIFVKWLVKVTKIGKEEQIAKLSGLLMSISFAMLLMVGVCKLVGMLSIGELLKGVVFATAFILLIKSLVAVTKIGEKEQMAKVAGTILAASFAIAVMAGVCILLSLISLPDLAKGVVAVIVFGVLIKTMIEATKDANDIKGNLIAMTVAIGIMAASVALLSFIDPTKLAGATAAMTILMGMFALMTLSAKNAQGAMGSLIVLTVAVAVIAGVLYLLSSLDPTQAISTAGSLSVLLLTMSVSLRLVANMGPMAIVGAASLAGVTLVVAALGGILYLLRDLNPEQAIGVAIALSALLVSMSAALLLVGIIGPMSIMGLVALAGLTLVVAALGGILYLLRDLNPEQSMKIVTAISTLLLSMSAALVVVGLIGPLAIIGLVAMAGLISLVAVIGTFLVAIGALVTKFPQLEEFLNKGLPLLEKIGYGIGSFFGSLIEGFATEVMKILPNLAANLSLFMVGLQPFIDGAKQLSGDTLDGVKSLVAMIAMITAASLLESITSWLTGSSSIDKFASQILVFGNAIVAFSNVVSGKIDKKSVNAAANAGAMIAKMQETLPGTGGVVQWFTGEKNMEDFGNQLVAFGKAIVKFSKTVSEGDGINIKAVNAAANAGKIMSEMQGNIESTGGVMQFFTGEKNMIDFGDQLVAYGKAIVKFSQTVSEGDGINIKAVQAAANAGKIMASMQENIEATGGVVDWFTGEKNMEDFGKQIKAFGEAMTDFSANTKIDQAAVTTAAWAGQIMSSLQKSLPESHWFDGKMTLDEFGENLAGFGSGISDYAEEVANVSYESVSNSITAANRLVALTQKVVGLDTSGISDFEDIENIGSAINSYADEVGDIETGKISKSIEAANSLITIIRNVSYLDVSGISNFNKVSSIGSAVKTYYDKISSVNTSKLLTSIRAVNQLKYTINSLATVNTEGISSFRKAIENLGKTNVDNFIKAFSGSTVKLATAGANMINSLVKGLLSKSSSLNNTARTIVNNLTKTVTININKFAMAGKMMMLKFTNVILMSAKKIPVIIKMMLNGSLSSVKAFSSSFLEAGMNLAAGLVIGMRLQIRSVYNAGYALGQAAAQGEKDGQKSNSPSKLTIENGKYLGEGLVIGITSMTKKVYKKGYGLGETAATSISKSIAKISDTIKNGVDTTPTIRPVLNLDDVVNGAKSIGRIFNKQSVDVMTNVGSISSMMSNRQNGNGNSDLLSELKGLRGDFASMDSGVNMEVKLDYNAGSDANDIANDIAKNLRRVIRRDI